MKRLSIILLIALGAFFSSSSLKASEQDSLKILWIGNSFTYVNDLPSMLTKIAGEQGIKLSPTRVLKGGEFLRGHYNNPRLIELLKQGGWDYVVMQDQSSIAAQHTALVSEISYKYAHLIDSLALVYSPKAKVIFYMTWGHIGANHHNKKEKDSAYPLDEEFEFFQSRLTTSYLEMTYDNKAWCAPVGLAWKTVREQYPFINLYKKDGYHPSVQGTFLAANCMLYTITRKPFETTQTFGIPRSEAKILHKVALETVDKYSKYLYYEK